MIQVYLSTYPLANESNAATCRVSSRCSGGSTAGPNDRSELIGKRSEKLSGQDRAPSKRVPALPGLIWVNGGDQEAISYRDDRHGCAPLGPTRCIGMSCGGLRPFWRLRWRAVGLS